MARIVADDACGVGDSNLGASACAVIAGVVADAAAAHPDTGFKALAVTVTIAGVVADGAAAPTTNQEAAPWTVA
jgi:hypothetical protein